MNDNEPFQKFPTYTEKSSRKSRLVFVLFVVVFIGIIILLGTVYIIGYKHMSFSNLMQKIPLLPQPTSTPIPTQVPPTPTPTQQVKASDVSLVVLNGSGESGVAQQVATFLEKKGYTVKTTGNADNYDYQGITIVTIKEKSMIEQLLEKDLQSYQHTGSIAAKTQETLSQGGDAEVIVGQ